MKAFLYRNTVLFSVLCAIVAQSYAALIVSFSVYLVVFAATTRCINARIFSLFFLAYFAIPFPNISQYRGTIEFSTLALYALIYFCVIHVMEALERRRPAGAAIPLAHTIRTESLFVIHMAIVYACLAYVYATIGPIVVRQDLRFTIPPAIEYVIKSGVAVPLAWAMSTRVAPTLRSAILRMGVPVLPSVLVGSRGSFLIVAIAIATAFFLFLREGPSVYQQRLRPLVARVAVYKWALAAAAILVVYSGFYLRRDGGDLLTPKDAIAQYEFTTPEPVSLALLPLYMGLREGPGITNRIVEEDIRNQTDVPLFFSELLTPLPGHQIAPGNVIAMDVYHATGSDEKYSLTPGIVGGTFIDFGYWGILIIAGLTAALVVLFNKGRGNLHWRALYCLSVVQFFHLFHRGFLKVEYFVPYVVVLAYMVTMRHGREQK